MHSLTKHPALFAIKTIAAGALLASASGLIHAQTAVSTSTASVRPGEPVTLNFVNAEIDKWAHVVRASGARAD